MMPGIRQIIILFLWTVSLLGLVMAEDLLSPLTLDEAVRLALERHPEIHIAQEAETELEGKIKEVRSEAFPQITLKGFALRLRDPSILLSSSFDDVPPEFRSALVPRANNMFDIGVSVKQPVYTAGKIRTALELAEVSLEEKKSNGESVRQQLAFMVFQAFHDLLLAEANRKVVEETYAQRQKHLEQARNRFEYGVATEIDVLRSEVNVANMEPELILADNQIRHARATLNNLIVVDLETPTKIEGELEYRPWNVDSLETIQEQSLERQPALETLRHQVQQSRLTLSLAHAQNKLSVDFEGQVGYTVRKPQDFFINDYSRYSLSVNFNLPLYDSGRKAGLVVQAVARMRSAEYQLTKFENDVQLEVKQAYDAMQSAAKAITSARLSVTQAEKVLEMMQANYLHGAATTLDVMDSQTALAVALNTRIIAIYAYEMAKARLRLASGSPILDREVNR